MTATSDRSVRKLETVRVTITFTAAELTACCGGMKHLMQVSQVSPLLRELFGLFEEARIKTLAEAQDEAVIDQDRPRPTGLAS